MRLYGKYRGRYGFNGSGFIGYRTRCSFFLLQFFYCKISVLRSLLRLLRTSNLENIREGRTVSEQRDIVLTVQTNVDADRRCRSSAGKDLARSFTGPKHDTVSVLFLAFSILKKSLLLNTSIQRWPKLPHAACESERANTGSANHLHVDTFILRSSVFMPRPVSTANVHKQAAHPYTPRRTQTVCWRIKHYQKMQK